MADIAGGAGAGAAAAGDSGAGAASGQSGASGASAAAGGQPGAQGGAAAAAAAAQEFKYAEDRSKWVHPDTLRTRLGEVTGKHTKEVERLQGELQLREQRMRVLAGLDPQASQQDQGKAEVRAAILEMFPGIDQLTPEQMQKLQGLAQNGELLQQTTNAYWDRHADQMVTSLKEIAASAIGFELNASQAKRLEREYTHFIRSTVAARNKARETGDTSYDFDNDALVRHNKGDQTLLKQFVKEFADDFVEPVRRQAVSQQAKRFGRPVPSGGREKQTVAQGPPDIDYNNEDAFKDALRKARNG